jgi:hypothetical protein
VIDAWGNSVRAKNDGRSIRDGVKVFDKDHTPPLKGLNDSTIVNNVMIRVEWRGPAG